MRHFSLKKRGREKSKSKAANKTEREHQKGEEGEKTRSQGGRRDQVKGGQSITPLVQRQYRHENRYKPTGTEQRGTERSTGQTCQHIPGRWRADVGSRTDTAEQKKLKLMCPTGDNKPICPQSPQKDSEVPEKAEVRNRVGGRDKL